MKSVKEIIHYLIKCSFIGLVVSLFSITQINAHHIILLTPSFITKFGTSILHWFYPTCFLSRLVHTKYC